MKKLFLTLPLAALLNPAMAQQTEFRVVLNSGLFSFSGLSAEANTFINHSDNFGTSYTNNPYGSEAGLCYGLAANMKRVTKSKLLFGLELGHDVLRSRVNVSHIAGYTNSANYDYKASGQTVLTGNFLNFHPFIGYRLPLPHFSLDLSGGLDVAYCLKMEEKGSATADNGQKYTTLVDRKTIGTDVRPRLQLAANYQKVGLFAGYSLGLANYMTGYVGGRNECYARLVRFGFSYQL